MARADEDVLSELLPGLQLGEGPADLEEAWSILGLLANAHRPSEEAEAILPPPAGAADDRPAPAVHDGSRLRLAEARYRTLIEQIPAVVFLASVEGGLEDIYVSPQIESLLGFTQTEWVSDPVLWYRQLHPDDRGRMSREFARTCVTGQPFRNVVRVFSRHGELVWIHTETRLVRDEAGRPLFLHGVGFDVTEQQRAEETRRQLLLEQEARSEAVRERERLDELFANLPAAIAVLHGPEHVIEFLNPAALKLAGGVPDLIGKSWREAFPGFPEEMEAVLQDVFSTGQPFTSTDWQAWHPLWTRERFFSFVCEPLRDRTGTVTSLLLHLSDVTEQRLARAAAEELAEENERLYREAQAASRLKDEFLATLSHELRTPLNAVVGWAHILRETLVDAPPQAMRAVEIIVRNADIQNQLISDLLDVSRIIAGKMVLKLQAVDLTTVIEAALDTVRPAAEARRIRLQPILDPSAGPVSGDPDRLQQVVWNLVSNAIKFAPKGGRVQVRLEAIDSHVDVVVEDDGPGIDPEFLPFLFERFRQADASSTRPHGGLGLGLAIVRHLVELHGGTVHAANRVEGTGAIFRVRLPRRSVSETGTTPLDRHPRAEAPARPEPDRPLDGLRILVVDDEPDALSLVEAVLESRGAETMAVASAAEAYEALLAGRFDLLLADIEMPGEDGYRLIGRVRDLPLKRGGGIPAVALTAYASSSDRVRALDAGFQAHVAKPVQAAELTAVVASLARARRRRRR